METIEALMQRAASARQRGQSKEERALLDRAVATFPASAHALNARGMLALADADLDLAIDCFGRATAADPGEPALLLNLATAQRRRGDSAGERNSLQRALDLDQLGFMAQLRMAELLERQGEASLAARHWGAVVQLAANTADAPPLVREAAARGQRFLDDHNALYAAALDREIGRKLPDTWASKRFRTCVDHMLGRRRLYRNECAGLHYPFLPPVEFFDRNLFPWLKDIESCTDAIRDEGMALLARGGDAIKPYVRLDPGTPANRWTDLDRSLDWSACFLWECGVRNDPVCEQCPATAAALEALPVNHVPGKAPSAFFSILRPGARIPPHTGVTNTRAIVHLPLVVPDGCGFRVGGEIREWRESEAFAFDDTIEHEAWNDGDRQRIVLIFDVWNPYLESEEQNLLAKLFAVADRGIVMPKA